MFCIWNKTCHQELTGYLQLFLSICPQLGTGWLALFFSMAPPKIRGWACFWSGDNSDFQTWAKGEEGSGPDSIYRAVQSDFVFSLLGPQQPQILEWQANPVPNTLWCYLPSTMQHLGLVTLVPCPLNFSSWRLDIRYFPAWPSCAWTQLRQTPYLQGC